MLKRDSIFCILAQQISKSVFKSIFLMQYPNKKNNPFSLHKTKWVKCESVINVLHVTESMSRNSIGVKNEKPSSGAQCFCTENQPPPKAPAYYVIPVWVPVAPFLPQLPTAVPGNAVEDGSSPEAPPMWKSFLAIFCDVISCQMYFNLI